MFGTSPFYSQDDDTVRANIIKGKVEFPPRPITEETEWSEDAVALLLGLLEIDPFLRWGSRFGRGVLDIKGSKFYTPHVDWEKLLRREVEPPFRPPTEDDFDLRHFYEAFTSEAVSSSTLHNDDDEESPRSDEHPCHFRNFDFELSEVIDN